MTLVCGSPCEHVTRNTCRNEMVMKNKKGIGLQPVRDSYPQG